MDVRYGIHCSDGEKGDARDWEPDWTRLIGQLVRSHSADSGGWVVRAGF